MKKVLTLAFVVFAIHTLAQKPGEVLFSASPIDPANPQHLTTEFKVGEHIYAIAYVPEVIDKYYPYDSPNKPVTTEVFLYTVKPPLYSYHKEDREEQLTFTNINIKGSLRANNYLLIEIAPDPTLTTVYSNPDMKFREFGKKWDGPAKLARDLATLEAGANKLKVVVNMNYNPVATGTFNLIGDDFSFYADLSERLNQVAAEGGAASAVFPKAEMSNPTLEKRMIEVFKSSNDWKNGRFDAVEILKISIYDKDWHIRRHQISGIIIERYIRASIAVKRKNGQCGYYNVTFKEDYVGGKYQPMKYDGSTELFSINCENLNK